jgi:NTE family protein
MSETMQEEVKKEPPVSGNQYVILALQGGGALGAFQAGAYQALTEKKYEPDWVTGISIGAINAALIAGNAEEDRLKQLKKFWRLVTGNLDWWERMPNCAEKLTNAWKVGLTMAGGVSGFFQPNFAGPFGDPNARQASSLYDTRQLRRTLESLVNFERINNCPTPWYVRLSLGATRVFGGVSETFHNFDGTKSQGDPDEKRTVISVDHVMASGALPPSFPGVRIKDQSGGVIEDQLYWDGGITSNSSFKHIIQHIPALYDVLGHRDVLIFVIDLWGAFDREPRTFDEVCWRIKQIQYSSRIEQDIQFATEFISNERQRQEADPKFKLAHPDSKFPRIDIIRVSYRSHPNEIPFGDALFSQTEIDRRFRDGYAAMRTRLEMVPRLWEQNIGSHTDVAVHLF